METGIDHIINIGRHQRYNWTLLGLIGVGVLLIGAFAGSIATASGWFSNGGGGKVPVYVSADSNINQQVTLYGGFSPIAKAVTPAVVTINVSSRARPQRLPNFLDPFRDFFGDPDQEEGTPRRRTIPQPTPGERLPLRPTGVGSGVIVSPDGYIITNNHVVADADKIEIELNDKRQFTAKLIGADAPSDIAVLKIDATDLPVVPLGDSDKTEVGDIVLAIGNPLGIGQTVTLGIISAKGRRSPAGDNSSYEDFIQTDAAINRGNSGGALVNLKGELIGVPSQILSQTGGSIGIGFAIPTKMARNVMDQLIRTGKVSRGKLGIFVRDVSPALAKQFGYEGTRGAFVDDIEKGAPADQAGVKPGDIVTEFKGQRIEDSSQLRNSASQTAPGTSVKFKVWRDNKEIELTAKLAEVDLASNEERENTPQSGTPSSGVLSGVRVENLTAEWYQRLNQPTSVRGVVVTEISPTSNAAAAGLRRGDVITAVAREAVTNVDDFNSALKNVDKNSVLLRIRRGDRGFFVLVQAQE
ncbi:MAG: DegQ family serine endoprotease [Acidobacteriota bacterium]|nr:MAG: DegQ family serine endoprotease [Acidobacteriota bacterium]